MNITSLGNPSAQGQCGLWTLEQLPHTPDWGQRPWHGARALGAGRRLPPQRWAHTRTALSGAEGRHRLGWTPPHVLGQTSHPNEGPGPLELTLLPLQTPAGSEKPPGH